jgi:hypothetical protein
MVHVIDRPEARKLSLPEYVDYIRENMDPRSVESILEHAWALRALANDRDFLLEEILRYGHAVADGLSDPGKGGATIVLAEQEAFYVRANIWLPDGERGSEEQLSFYSYDLPHDHNFTFLTVGYMGSGYRTELYRYDYDLLDGVPGEPSQARACGIDHLTPGKMMLYEAGKDIHIQFPPATPSVSLNLIIRPVLGRDTQQYIFSRDASRIVGGSTDTVTNRLSMLEFCIDHHDESTIRQVEEIARGNACFRTQAYALSVLRRIAPDRAAIVEDILPAPLIERSRLQPVRAEARMG